MVIGMNSNAYIVSEQNGMELFIHTYEGRTQAEW